MLIYGKTRGWARNSYTPHPHRCNKSHIFVLSRAPGCGFRHKDRESVLLRAFASVFRHKNRLSVLHFTRTVREVNVVQGGGMRLSGDQVRESQFNASAPAQGEKRAAFAGSSPGLGPLAEIIDDPEHLRK